MEKCRWRIALKAAAFQDIRAILYFASIMCNFLPASLPVTPPELRTKLTTSRRESLLKHCRKSHRERDSQRERERKKSVTPLSTDIETSEKIKSFYIMTKEGQERELRWGCEKQKKHKEGRKMKMGL